MGKNIQGASNSLCNGLGLGGSDPNRRVIVYGPLCVLISVFFFSYRHSNIITLIGYSAYGPKTCLVYEFMANGSLNNRLRCKVGSNKGDESPFLVRQTPCLEHWALRYESCILGKHVPPD